MRQIIKNNLLEIIILITLTLTVLIEKTLMLVPTLQYFIIGVIGVVYVMSFLITVFFRNRTLKFYDEFRKYYRKALFYSMFIIAIILFSAIIYETFYMSGDKKVGYLLLAFLIAVITIPNKYYYHLTVEDNTVYENNHRGENSNQPLIFLFSLLIILTFTIVLYKFPNMKIFRFLINTLVLLTYIMASYLAVRKEVKHESI